MLRPTSPPKLFILRFFIWCLHGISFTQSISSQYVVTLRLAFVTRTINTLSFTSAQNSSNSLSGDIKIFRHFLNVNANNNKTNHSYWLLNTGVPVEYHRHFVLDFVNLMADYLTGSLVHSRHCLFFVLFYLVLNCVNIIMLQNKNQFKSYLTNLVILLKAVGRIRFAWKFYNIKKKIVKHILRLYVEYRFIFWSLL